MSNRERESRCDESEGHSGPFFTVTVLAVLVGSGTRGKHQKRRVGRKTIGRFCRECVRSLEFRTGKAEFRALGHEVLRFEVSHEAED